MTIHARNIRRPPAPILTPTRSPIEEQFALQIRADKLPRPIREFQFHPTRRWRLDFAWPDMLLAVEIEGEVHRIKSRFHSDLEKHAELALAGWTLLRVGGRQVRSGIGLQWLKRLLWERAPLGLSKAHGGSDTRLPARATIVPVSKGDTEAVDNPAQDVSNGASLGQKCRNLLITDDFPAESYLT